MAADWLSSAFGDRKSYSGFLVRCAKAWFGELRVAQLVSVHDQAMGSKGEEPRGGVHVRGAGRRLIGFPVAIATVLRPLPHAAAESPDARTALI